MEIEPSDDPIASEINNPREKRVRKSVSRLSDVYDKTFDLKSDRAMKPVTGNGTKLGDIKRMQDACHRCKVNGELAKNIHLLCYRTIGKAGKRLSEIKKFNGFNENDESEFKKRLALIDKMKIEELKQICDLFNVHPSGKMKKDISLGIVEYLRSPFETGSETFRTSSLKKKKKITKVKSSEKKPVKEKAAKSVDSVESSVDKNSSISEAEVENNESEQNEEKSVDSDLKNNEKKTGKLKQKNLESTGKTTTTTTTTNKNKMKTKTKEKSSKLKSIENQNGGDENENNNNNNNSISSIKMISHDPNDDLSDEVLKEKISAILSGADLSKITLNQVCDGVVEQFPDVDLVLRRPHIKSLVKQVLDQAS